MKIKPHEVQIAELRAERNDLQQKFDEFEEKTIPLGLDYEPESNPYYKDLMHVKEMLERWDK